MRRCWRRFFATAEASATAIATPLPQGVIKVHGPDSAKLLQNLLTADINALKPGSCTYAGFLSPKGRVLYDAVISRPENDVFYLETPEASKPGLMSHLRRYSLRQKVTFEDKSEELRVWAVASRSKRLLADALLQVQQAGNAVNACFDPRTELLGVRLLLPATANPSFQSPITVTSPEIYDAWRLLLGIPLGGADLLSDKSLPIESNFDWLNGVSFTKGCYLGQELTARVHFQGLVRKRLFPVLLKPLDAPAPSPCELRALSSGFAEQHYPVAPLLPVPPVDAAFPASALPAHGATVHLHAPGAEPAPAFTADAGAGGEAQERGAGKLFSSRFNLAMALLRLEHVLPRQGNAQGQNVPAPAPTAPMDLKVQGANGSWLRVYPFVPLWWPLTIDG